MSEPSYDEMLAAFRLIDEILLHNPDAAEPPRYRNARAARVVRDILAKAEGRATPAAPTPRSTAC